MTFEPGSSLETIRELGFQNTAIKTIVIPSRVRALGVGVFQDCKNLGNVVFQEGSVLEQIGVKCFCSTGLREIEFPQSLRTIGDNAFGACGRLRVVFVHEGYLREIRQSLPQHVTLFWNQTIIGNLPLQSYRMLKDVVVPDFVERIEDHWFAGSAIENIWIPDSVRELGHQAFQWCTDLRYVIFGCDSQLEKICV